MMKFVSLFSGIGGIDLGLDRVGMTCVAQVEIDPHARGVLAHHWPHVPKLEDVRDVNAKSVPRCDLLAGGSPCQGFSVAGRRAGLADDRSGLWWEFSRIIGELAPSWVLVENVDGLLSANCGRDFRAVVGSMVERGYCVGWRVFDAQYFGLAQHRERVFIVGHLGTNPRLPAEILFESACLSRGAEKSGGMRNQIAGKRGVGSASAFDWQSGGDSRGLNPRPYTSALSKSQVPAVHDGVNDVRRLMPIECERLQGFPDNHTAISNGKPQSDSRRYQQLGNAAPVPVVEWIAKRIAIAAGISECASPPAAP